MTTPFDDLDRLVDSFVRAWSHSIDDETGRRLLAETLLVLGSDGAKPVSRQDLLRAAFGRADAVADAEAPVPVVSDVQTHPLGDRMALATVTWRFGDVPLVSDFLLERTDDGLRCVAYLPRTNVLDHLA